MCIRDRYAPFGKFQGGCLDITAILYYVTVIVLFNFFTVQAIPVSYTHLMKNIYTIGIPATLNLALPSIQVSALNAVSYTHLDVHKRQVCGTADLKQFWTDLYNFWIILLDIMYISM